jgi:hypothetical protein
MSSKLFRETAQFILLFLLLVCIRSPSIYFGSLLELTAMIKFFPRDEIGPAFSAMIMRGPLNI